MGRVCLIAVRSLCSVKNVSSWLGAEERTQLGRVGGRGKYRVGYAIKGQMCCGSSQIMEGVGSRLFFFLLLFFSFYFNYIICLDLVG